MTRNDAIRLAVRCINAQLEQLGIEPSIKALSTKRDLIEARAILNDLKEPPVGDTLHPLPLTTEGRA
jgi:hypothetical protein